MLPLTAIERAASALVLRGPLIQAEPETWPIIVLSVMGVARAARVTFRQFVEKWLAERNGDPNTRASMGSRYACMPSRTSAPVPSAHFSLVTIPSNRRGSD